MIAQSPRRDRIYPSGPMMKGSAHAFAARTMGQAGMIEDIPSPRFAFIRLMYPNDYFE
jgi:hypothetical protein